MSARALVWTVIVALAVLDVLVLLNIAALWVVDNPARLVATLPLALGHAFWSARLCSDFELNDRTTWREFFVGLPMLPLAATPYGWLTIGASTATPTASYGLGGVAAVIAVVGFGLACLSSGTLAAGFLGPVFHFMRRSVSGADPLAHVRVASAIFGGWTVVSGIAFSYDRAPSDSLFSESSVGSALTAIWLVTLLLSLVGLLWSLVALVMRRAV